MIYGLLSFAFFECKYSSNRWMADKKHCEDRKRLFDQWKTARRAYMQAASELAHLSRSDLHEKRANADHAKERVTVAKAALRHHELSHACTTSRQGVAK